MNEIESTAQYDKAFGDIPGLVWLPWVGNTFSQRKTHKKLLVVGESHYYVGDTSEERQANREKWLKYPQFTRDVVSESLVSHEWTTKTLNTIPKLLFKTTEIDRSRLWGDSAYYNFVQRMMDYNREGGSERPCGDDYAAGWRIFSEIVRIIQPSHCLFIGVSASDGFNHWIESQNVFSGKVSLTQNIGGTSARTAKLEVAGTTTELIFVKHLGLPISWSQWHDYLRAQHTDFMNWLEAESYVTNGRS